MRAASVFLFFTVPKLCTLSNKHLGQVRAGGFLAIAVRVLSVLECSAG